MPDITVKVIDNRLKEYMQQAEIDLSQGKFDHALAHLYRGLSLAEALHDDHHFRELCHLIAEAHHDMGQAEQVVEWCDIALRESLPIGMRCRLIELKALNLLRLGLFKQAYDLLKDFEQDENLQTRRMALMTLGLLHVHLFRYLRLLTLEKAEEYLKDVEKLNKDQEDAAVVAGQIHYYYALKLIEEGLFYYAKERLLHAQQLTESKVKLSQIYNELGRVSIKLMEFDEAVDYFDKARNLALQNLYNYGLNYNIYYRGLLYTDLLQTENACSHFLTSLYDFLRKKQFPEVAMIFYLLSQLYESQNSEKSDKYCEEWNTYISKLESTVAEENVEEIYQWMSS